MNHIIHDHIKIQYVREGYLPNIPYHLISDEEMCRAFMGSPGDDYWSYMYPCPDDNLQTYYDALKADISWHLEDLLSHEYDPYYSLPDWVYSYMMGKVISEHSPQYDKHDLLVMLGVDNLNDIFTPDAAERCYEVSQQWLRKIPPDQLVHRPPTIFGEPHVLKALRLRQAEVL